MFKFLWKTGLSLVVATLCLIPLWIFLAAKGMLNPSGFWQNLVLFGVGVWFLGAIQVVLFVVLVFVVLKIWLE